MVTPDELGGRELGTGGGTAVATDGISLMVLIVEGIEDIGCVKGNTGEVSTGGGAGGCIAEEVGICNGGASSWGSSFMTLRTLSPAIEEAQRLRDMSDVSSIALGSRDPGDEANDASPFKWGCCPTSSPATAEAVSFAPLETTAE